MRALVISGGGSKGAFAGGVAQFLIEEQKNRYDLFLGTSTGSLLVPHLALKKVEKIKRIFTSANQYSIFSKCPFRISQKRGATLIRMNHWSMLRNVLSGSRTFGESYALRSLIQKEFTEEEYSELQNAPLDVVVTVSNISMNRVEYKSLSECSYAEFVDWIWISCNYAPFMSLVTRNGCDYADGGLGSQVPIAEAIRRGATELDVIILATEVTISNRLPSTNPFALINNMTEFLLDRIENQNIQIGKYAAVQNNVILNLYYTPTILTTNSLVFEKEQMQRWWQSGLEYAQNKSPNSEFLNKN